VQFMVRGTDSGLGLGVARDGKLGFLGEIEGHPDGTAFA
jgi:hypothetical protein